MSTGKVAALSRATAFEASWAVISHSAYDAGQAHERLVCRSAIEKKARRLRRLVAAAVRDLNHPLMPMTALCARQEVNLPRWGL